MAYFRSLNELIFRRDLSRNITWYSLIQGKYSKVKHVKNPLYCKSFGRTFGKVITHWKKSWFTTKNQVRSHFLVLNIKEKKSIVFSKSFLKFMKVNGFSFYLNGCFMRKKATADSTDVIKLSHFSWKLSHFSQFFLSWLSIFVLFFVYSLFTFLEIFCCQRSLNFGIFWSFLAKYTMW